MSLFVFTFLFCSELTESCSHEIYQRGLDQVEKTTTKQHKKFRKGRDREKGKLFTFCTTSYMLKLLQR